MKNLILFILIFFISISIGQENQQESEPFAYLNFRINMNIDLYGDLNNDLNFSLDLLEEYDTNYIEQNGKMVKINRLFKKYLVKNIWYKGDSSDSLEPYPKSTKTIKFYPKSKNGKKINNGDTVFFRFSHYQFENIYTFIIFQQNDTFKKVFSPKYLKLR